MQNSYLNLAFLSFAVGKYLRHIFDLLPDKILTLFLPSRCLLEPHAMLGGSVSFNK
jgi:hypothetical protein